jgi:hypothetical protein
MFKYQVLAKQQMDLLTAKAWFYENNQLEMKVVKLSIQNSIPSEYTRTILLQNFVEKIEQGKQKPKKNSTQNEQSATSLNGLTLGFGDTAATRENLSAGFGDTKPPERFEMFDKAVGCCSRLTDCCCCMCFINTCSKMNDRCAIVMVQLCGALSCLACFECCSLCCGGSD